MSQGWLKYVIISKY